MMNLDFSKLAKIEKKNQKQLDEEFNKWHKEKMKSLSEWQQKENCVIVPLFQTTLDTIQAGFTIQPMKKDGDNKAEKSS